MKLISTTIMLGALLCLASCRHNPSVAVYDGDWQVGTNKLSKAQIASITDLLRIRFIEPSEKPLPPRIGGVPIGLAPDLCIDMMNKSGSTKAQLLGFDRKWLVFESRYVVTDSNTVLRIYGVVKNDPK